MLSLKPVAVDVMEYSPPVRRLRHNCGEGGEDTNAHFFSALVSQYASRHTSAASYNITKIPGVSVLNMRALFVGRFQPLHWGHVKVVEWLLTHYDEVVIALGSADKALTFENPFTPGERLEMFRRHFGPNCRLLFCTVPDTGGSSSLWGAYVRHWCPPYQVAYSNNPYVAAALEYWGGRGEGSPTPRGLLSHGGKAPNGAGRSPVEGACPKRSGRVHRGDRRRR